jgi:2-methylaconitate cis-trans-isomerase PrpF
MSQTAVAATLMRGGTSKGVFFLPQDLPPAQPERDRLFLAVIGSPDPYARQINGMGGATSSTSKICIVGGSSRTDADVDFTFGHVDIMRPVIDYTGNCGNLLSAVGVFAIEQRLVPATPPLTRIRVWQTNLQQHLVVSVPTHTDGSVIVEGETAVAGVAGSGSPIAVDFLHPKDVPTFPTGNRADAVSITASGAITTTLLQAGNPTVFALASDFGLRGDELPHELTRIGHTIEQLRCAGGAAMGMGTPEQIGDQPATPKVCLLAPPGPYTTSAGARIPALSINIQARMFSMGLPHNSITGTGTVALGVAACIPGTIVADIANPRRRDDYNVTRIGHSAGVTEVSARFDDKTGEAISATVIRTARTLMRGEVLVPTGN